MLESLQSPGEPQDPPEVPHWREALHVRIPGVYQGLQQRFRQSQTSEQDSLQRGKLAHFIVVVAVAVMKEVFIIL